MRYVNSLPGWRFTDNDAKVKSSVKLADFAGTLLVRLERERTLTQSDFARRIGQFFLVAVTEELKVRQLCPNRIAIRSTLDRKNTFSTDTRMHIELDVAVQGRDVTQNQFIDAVLAARRICLATALPGVMLRLTAQLELDT